MGGPANAAAAPDVQPGYSQLDGASCLGYAVDRVFEYGAALRFIGLLAGIKGPNDTDADVDAARAAVREALSGIGVAPPSDAQQAHNDLEYAKIAQRRIEAQEGMTVEQWKMGSEHAAAWQAAGSPKGLDYNRWLETGAAIPTNVRNAQMMRRQAANDVDLARQYRDAAERELLSSFFPNLWESIKKAYNDAVAAIRNGTWKLALCKLAVDAGFAVLEAGLIAALSTIGLAAVAAFLKVVAKVSQAGSKLVRITVKATRNVVQRGIGDPNKIDKDVVFPKQIDTRKDLTSDEKRVLGEENQGTTTKTNDAGITETDGASSGKGSAARAAKKEDDVPPSTVLAPKHVDCFEVPKGVSREVFEGQLQKQQETIRKMTVDDLAYAHLVLDQAEIQWRAKGKKGSSTDLLRDKDAQDAVRTKYKELLRRRGKTDAQIAQMLSDRDATHFLDMIAGGHPSSLGIGNSTANRSIGPQWNAAGSSGNKRADQLRNEVKEMRAKGLHDQTMNHIVLKAC
ncbi:MAG: hypothetical protein HC844_11535 [Tabrizicola sp.]|nr:hypothetical protein [Tabrizicola sp.]